MLMPDITLPESAWVAIPVFNHAATLRQVVSKVLELGQHLVIVDDGSTDAPVRETLTGIDIKILEHPCNQGKGAALRTAAEYISGQGGKWMITLDADGQHDPADIALFIPYLDENPDKIIIGVRQFSSDTVPERSKFGRRFSNFWIKLETGQDPIDSQSGFRAYPVKLLVECSCRAQHYAYETEILVRACWAGLSLLPIKISVYYPEREKRVSHFKPFVDNLRISLLHTKLCCRKLIGLPQ